MRVEITLRNTIDAPLTIENLRGVLAFEQEGNTMRFRVQEESVIPILVSEMVARKAEITLVSPQKVSLEDIYFKLQNEVRESAS